MREVFQEYGGVIITIVAIVSMITMITAIMGTGQSGDGGIVYEVFENLITNFAEKAGISSGVVQ